MAANEKPIATPEWLERAAQTELPAAFDRVALSPTARPVAEILERVALTSSPAAATKPARPEPKSARPDSRPSNTKLENETDVHRRSLDGAALLPSTVGLGLLTLGMVTLAKPFVPARFVTELISLPILALWTGLIIFGGYRMWAYRYRMTSHRLFRERGRLYPADEPLELSLISKVEVRQSRLQDWLDVGDVIVTPEESSGRPPFELTGVRWPEKLAALIETTAAAGRDRSVKWARSSSASATR
jgi:hypothetical protein